MSNILRHRLPERLASLVPKPVVELFVGLFAAVLTVGARMPLDPVLDERAPYVFVFLGIVVASLLAGWRSGLVALFCGQALTWFAVIEPRLSFAIADSARAAGLVVGTISELLILGAIALYQREIDAASLEREGRIDLLRQALREIDHRTKNNYQTVLSLLQLQSRRVGNSEARHALQIAADRIEAIALVSQQLAHRSEDLRQVRLGDHLRRLCTQVERGLVGDGVTVDCDVEEVPVSADKAIEISIIVNELITNSLKHAFPDRESGTIRVSSRARNGGVELVVGDDGCGLGNPANGCQPISGASAGLGSKLIETFVRQLGASHVISSGERGTIHRIQVPSLA